MHPTQDFDRGRGLPPNWEALSQDLDLEALWGAMARGDEALFEVARQALLCSLTDAGAIAYRQRALADCLRHPTVVREMYATAVAAVTGRRRIFGFTPAAVLDVSVRTLSVLLPHLRRLRVIAAEAGAGLRVGGLPEAVRRSRVRTGRGVLADARRPPGPAALPPGSAAERAPGPGQCRHGLHRAAPAGSGLEGAARSAAVPAHPASVAARRRLGGSPGADSRQGPQPPGRRARPVCRPRPGVLQVAANGAGVLRGVPEPARALGRERGAGVLPGARRPRGT